jgi:hypothetical protein
VRQPSVGRGLAWCFAVVFAVIGTSETGYGQPPGDCQMPRGRAAGVSVGRSSPYFDLAREAVDAGTRGSILVRGGFQLAARADLPIAGPWRARVEGSASDWRVVRQRYGDDFQLIATDRVGDVEAREIAALVGRQGGRAPVCGYVLAGGGIYSLTYRGASLHRPGAALTAGIEVPTGDRGAVQVDVQLRLINTGGRYPISSSDVLAGSLSAGWVFRF